MLEANQTAPPAPRPRWTPTIKVVVGVIIIVLLGLAIYRFQIVFAPLIIGAIIAYIFQPLVTLISQRIRIGRGLATVLIFLLLLGIIVPIIASLTPVVIDQLEILQGEIINAIDFIRTLSPDTTVSVLGFEFGVQTLIDQAVEGLTDAIRTTAPESVTLVFGVAETVLMVIFTLLIGFYLTKDAPRMAEWAYGIVPPAYASDIRQLMAEIDRIWSSFFRGQVTLALVVFVIITAVSSVLGLPQPIILGVLAGFLEFLPSIGHAIWIVIALILALLEGSTTLPVSNFVFALIVAGAHFGFTQFDLNFLIPRIIGREVNLHPMVVILGIIVGASVGGVLGVALAAPTIASIRIIARYIYAMLFDLDPFPMVGPPAASAEERREQLLEELEEQAAAAADPYRPGLLASLSRRRKSGERQPPPAPTEHE